LTENCIPEPIILLQESILFAIAQARLTSVGNREAYGKNIFSALNTSVVHGLGFHRHLGFHHIKDFQQHLQLKTHDGASI
jgi:hypothetical protein